MNRREILGCIIAALILIIAAEVYNKNQRGYSDLENIDIESLGK